MDTNQHILSIIAVTLNETRHIERLKKSVDQLRLPARVIVETVLLDGGSSDGTADIARHVGFSKIIVLPDANIPVCRNRAVTEAKGDWIAFVDGDCELASDWLEAALPYLNNLPSVIIGWPARPPDPMTWVQNAWHAHWTHKNIHYETVDGRAVVRHEGFRLVTTRNMILHRGVYDAVGGFNESLPTGEDTDFVFRAYSKGIPVLGVPTLNVVHHAEPATWKQFYLQQLWHANRTSYKTIAQTSGTRVGSNAPLFTLLFMAGTLLLLAAPIVAWAICCPSGLILILPLIALIAGPALMMSRRAHDFSLFLPLCALYFAYGLARSLDMLGFARRKTNWKTADR